MSDKHDDAIFPRESLGALFRKAAAAFADRVAVNFGDGQVSYRRLLEEAERIAGGLRASGIKPGDAVGVHGDRSLDAVKSIVGVVLAGGIYVPLSPQWPRARLEEVVEQAGIAALVDCTGRGVDCGGGTVLPLSTLVSTAERHAGDDGRGPDDCLYVLFTSGSSGRPKGVLVPHRGVVRLVFDRALHPIDPGMGVAHAAPLTFDASTMEIWLPLLTGGVVCGFTKEEILTAQAFRAARGNRDLHICFFTYALFEALTAQDPAALAGIARLYVGGEVVQPATVRKMLATPGVGTLINVYGPTETTVYATFHEIGAADAAGDIIPIGRPIARTSAHVLDEDRKPVAAGAEGELYLGGDGVALGYLGDTGLTAERFIDDPLAGSGRTGGRLYRTGDRVRQRQDGAIEYLGRIDDQIKLRGHRIEPGEIEAVLNGVAGIERAIVRVHEPAAGDRRLAAWIKPTGGDGGPDDARLLAAVRQHACETLPDYMVPSWFLVVRDFPLTAHGKLDFAAFPKPGATGAATAAIDLSEPLDGVVAILRQLLVDERFGPEDSFLAAGGDSLLAVRGAQQIARASGITPPVSSFFGKASATAIADYLRLAAWARGAGPVAGQSSTAVTRF